MNDITNCEIRNTLDDEGHPTGGLVIRVGLDIEWQYGQLGPADTRGSPNGAFVETVISAALQRLQFYNNSEFRCRENSLAITHLEEALHWLEARTKDREKRNVEGTHTV